jgi:hypothetical protein
MNNDKKSSNHETNPLFRRKAVEYYAYKKQKRVFLKFVSQRALGYLWLLTGIIIISIFSIVLIKVPVSTSGIALLSSDCTQKKMEDNVLLTIFLSPDVLPYLQYGQKVSLQINKVHISGTLIAIEPEIDFGIIKNRIGTQMVQHPFITQPSAIAYALFGTSQKKDVIEYNKNTVYKVRVEIGLYKIITQLPFARKINVNKTSSSILYKKYHEYSKKPCI